MRTLVCAFTLALLVVGAFQSASAQSGTCNASLDPLICSSPRLRAINESAESWRDRIGQSAPDASYWRQQRARCRANAQCLEETLQREISEIQLALSNEPSAHAEAAAPSYEVPPVPDTTPPAESVASEHPAAPSAVGRAIELPVATSDGVAETPPSGRSSFESVFGWIGSATVALIALGIGALLAVPLLVAALRRLSERRANSSHELTEVELKMVPVSVLADPTQAPRQRRTGPFSLVVHQPGQGAMLLRNGRRFIDAAAFFAIIPFIAFLVFMIILACVAVGGGMVESWLDLSGQPVAHRDFVSGASRQFLFALALPPAMICVVSLCSMAREGRPWAATLTALASPAIFYFIQREVTNYTSTFRATDTVSMLAPTLCVLAAPLLLFAGSLLVLAAPLAERTQAMGSPSVSRSTTSIGMFAARYGSFRQRLVGAASLSVAHVFAGAVCATAAFLAMAALGYFSGPILSTWRGVPLTDEDRLFFAFLIVGVLGLMGAVVESLLGLATRRGLASINLVVGVLAAVGLWRVLALFESVTTRQEGGGDFIAIDGSLVFVAGLASLYVVRGFVGSALVSSTNRLARASAATALELSSRRKEAPVLFLRSFADDEQAVTVGDGTVMHALGAATAKARLEEIVAKIMFARGPLIALANPRVRSAPIGAARDVVSPDNWQETVLRYLDRAQGVVCFFGRTPSFLWEVREIIRAGMLSKLVLIFPAYYLKDRWLTRDAPDLAQLLGLVDRQHEEQVMKGARALTFDPASHSANLFVSTQASAFDYERAILGASSFLGEMEDKAANIPSPRSHAGTLGRWSGLAAVATVAAAAFVAALYFQPGTISPATALQALDEIRPNEYRTLADGVLVQRVLAHSSWGSLNAAARFDKRAQLIVGHAHYSGVGGVQRDYWQAAQFYRTAALQGDVSAEVRLGTMFASGRGVGEDHVQAARLYRLAADQGDAEGQFLLGGAYLDGLGVPRDCQAGVRYYRLASDQNNMAASILLFSMIFSEHPCRTALMQQP